ncbi:MAG: Crp/Fnr family transcriptional regulator [Actinomycetota bacterium]|jgi:CRP-like cAMP-binding protein|nr:Crp/Fnr family transcriptional regulator [Actinomycetota bacterium]|tara:strand:- start:9 stop:680 length:672 start_codon:yes stop_codon:yes gene_type:complete
MTCEMIDHTLFTQSMLFGKLNEKELEPIVEKSAKKQLLRGDVLFRENDKPFSLFLVETGRIAIVNKSFIGKESVIALMENGDLFGEMGLFDERGRSAEARALEESCVIEVPYEPINKLYEENPSQLWEVVTMLVNRLRNMDEVLADSVFLDVTGRTAKRLLEISDNEDEFSLPVTQEELAGMVGASRERVNKAIASFIKLGWIEQFDRTYRILDREQLTIRSR